MINHKGMTDEMVIKAMQTIIGKIVYSRYLISYSMNRKLLLLSKYNDSVKRII